MFVSQKETQTADEQHRVDDRDRDAGKILVDLKRRGLVLFESIHGFCFLEKILHRIPSKRTV